MKLLQLFVFLILTVNAAFAKTDTLYFNDVWKYTDRNHAMYYRVVKKQDNGKFGIADHYMDGTLQMTGTNTSLDTPDENYREGLFTYYYPNGGTKEIGNMVNGKRQGWWTLFYDSDSLIESPLYYKNGLADGDATYYDSVTQASIIMGHFTNDNQSGKWIYRDRKGRITEIRNYSSINGEVIAIAVTYNDKGQKMGTGKIVKNKYMGLWKFYDPKTGTITYKKTYINNELNGELTGYYADGKLRRKETYSFGKMITGKCYAEDGKEIDYFSATYPLRIPFKIADYLKANLIYPAEAKAEKIQGEVVVGFTIDEKGKPINIKVLQGIGGGCDEEAVRLIKAMPKWTPRMEERKLVKTPFVVPISFILK